MSDITKESLLLSYKTPRMVVTSPGSQLSALRKRVKHKCPICGKEFEGIQKAKYCSGKCRQEGFRRKKGEA